MTRHGRPRPLGPAINDALGLSAPIRDEAHYAELLAFVDEAFEQFGETTSTRSSASS